MGSRWSQKESAHETSPEQTPLSRIRLVVSLQSPHPLTISKYTQATTMKFSQALSAMFLSSSSFASNAYMFGARRGSHALAGSSSTQTAFAVNTSSRTSSSSIRLMASSSSPVEDLIQSEIDSNKIMVFSKSYCPYCAATKSLFSSLGVDFKVIELDQRPDGSDIQNKLAEMTGQRTVPNTFINGKHLGGNDKAQAANSSGELKKMLGL